MESEKIIFIRESESKSANLEQRKRLNFNIAKYHHSVQIGLAKYYDLKLAKTYLKHIKIDVINRFHELLEQFIFNFEKRGGFVFIAKDSEEATNYIVDLCKTKQVELVVKSKSMTSEELHLNEVLDKNGIIPVETDLGEFIVQLAGEPPFHIVTPAMHKSKEDVADLFHDKFSTPINSSPEFITNFVRTDLRGKFKTAGLGISGANFLVADVGAISLTENEGNGLMSVSNPKIHVVIAGIEKLIPSVQDLNYFLPMLAVHGTGQSLTAYNSLIFSAATADEIDGPKEMHVVLLDNQRSNLLSYPNERISLTCIRCGACLNYCPIYTNIGGYTYKATYTGPIGSVITPFYNGFKKFSHLSFACTLCGKCSSVCPVRIPLHSLLLRNRNRLVENFSTKENYFYQICSRFLRHPVIFNRLNPDFKSFIISIIMKQMWGKNRQLPRIRRSFKKYWTEK